MDTIKSNAEISYLFSHGRRIHTSYLTLIVLPTQRGRSHSECGRVAFIAGKKLGNAVWRNSAKRRMREVCREIHAPWDGYDVVFLAKARILKVPYSKVIAACQDAVGRSSLTED